MNPIPFYRIKIQNTKDKLWNNASKIVSFDQMKYLYGLFANSKIDHVTEITNMTKENIYEND